MASLIACSASHEYEVRSLGINEELACDLSALYINARLSLSVK